MASIENYVFIEWTMGLKSVFEQAYIIVHELQHLIVRKEQLIYSPIIFAQDPELQLFFQNKTETIPLEAGHLYWSLMLGKVGITPNQIIESTLGKCCDIDYWESLSEEREFINFENVKGEQEYQRIPFSFKIPKPFKDFRLM